MSTPAAMVHESSPQSAAVDRRIPRGAAIVLLSILVVGAFLRIHALGRESLWLDEALSVEIAKGVSFHNNSLPKSVFFPAPVNLAHIPPAEPIAGVLNGCVDSGHPPIYFLALRWWCGIFGDTDASTRGISAIASLLALLLVFVAARETHGTSVALAAAGICALAGTQIQFAQEARNYAIVLPFILGALIALLRIERLGSSTARVISLFACSLGMMLSHYFAFGCAVAIGLYAVARLRGRDRVIVLATFSISAVIFCVFWGPIFLKQFRIFNDLGPLLDLPPDGRALRFAQRCAVIPLQFLTPAGVHTKAGIILGLLLYVPLVAAIRPKSRSFPFALVACGAIVTVIVLDLARGTRHLAFARYTFFASVPFYAVLAGSTANRRLKSVAAIVLLVSLTALLPYSYVPKPKWKLAAATIETAAGPAGPVVFGGNPDVPWYAGSLLLCASRYLSSPRPVALLDAPDASFVTAARPLDRFWYVGDPRGVPSSLASTWRATVVQPMGEIGTLYVLTRIPNGS